MRRYLIERFNIRRQNKFNHALLHRLSSQIQTCPIYSFPEALGIAAAFKPYTKPKVGWRFHSSPNTKYQVLKLNRRAIAKLRVVSLNMISARLHRHRRETININEPANSATAQSAAS
jgi:hypothetical protein